jgi:hypothetical protein
MFSKTYFLRFGGGNCGRRAGENFAGAPGGTFFLPIAPAIAPVGAGPAGTGLLREARGLAKVRPLNSKGGTGYAL